MRSRRVLIKGLIARGFVSPRYRADLPLPLVRKSAYDGSCGGLPLSTAAVSLRIGLGIDIGHNAVAAVGPLDPAVVHHAERHVRVGG